MLSESSDLTLEHKLLYRTCHPYYRLHRLFNLSRVIGGDSTTFLEEGEEVLGVHLVEEVDEVVINLPREGFIRIVSRRIRGRG